MHRRATVGVDNVSLLGQTVTCCHGDHNEVVAPNQRYILSKQVAAGGRLQVIGLLIAHRYGCQLILRAQSQ